MNNLCSIHIAKYDQIKLLAGSSAKAEFLSKCIFWWQISTYTLNDDKIWFTRSVEQMASELSLSTRTIARYLKALEADGLIERVSKLWAKKHLYIRITGKLLALINPTKSKPTTEAEITTTKQECSLLKQDGMIKTDSKSASIYKGKDSKLITNNIVSQPMDVIDEENKQTKAPSIEAATKTVISQPIAVTAEETKQCTTPSVNLTPSTKANEQVAPEIASKVKGMLYNLEHKQNVILANKERLTAEIMFSLSNAEQFRGIKCVKHKINIIALMLRKKRWCTPKGFYNHDAIGREFKACHEAREKEMEAKKLQQELLGITCPQTIAEIKSRFAEIASEDAKSKKTDTPAHRQDSSISASNANKDQQMTKKIQQETQALGLEIASEKRYLQNTQQDLAAGRSYVTQALLDSISGRIASLCEQKKALEAKLPPASVDGVKLCA